MVFMNKASDRDAFVKRSGAKDKAVKPALVIFLNEGTPKKKLLLSKLTSQSRFFCFST